MNEPTVNMQDFVLHSLRAAAIALKHLSAQRDEARAVARRLYAQLTSQIAIYNASIEINADLRKTTNDAIQDALTARRAWLNVEAENMRLRARLQELEGEQEPGP